MNEVRTKHTPGQWLVGAPYGLVKIEVIAPDSSRAVCTVWTKMSVADRETGRQVVSDDPEGHANARLIAAAPDLLELAQQFKQAVEFYIRVEEREYPEGAALKRVTLHRINAVLAMLEPSP